MSQVEGQVQDRDDQWDPEIKGPPPPWRCQVCGKRLRGQARKNCSRDCGSKFKQERRKERRRQTRMVRAVQDQGRCVVCGSTLPLGSRKDRMYCSDSCTHRAYMFRTTGSRTCMICGKTVIEIGTSKRYHVCSDTKCHDKMIYRRKHKKKMTGKIHNYCMVCGGLIHEHYDHAKVLICSQVCMSKIRMADRPSKPVRKRIGYYRHCLFCNIKLPDGSRKNKKYCSRHCKGRYNAEKRRGNIPRPIRKCKHCGARIQIWKRKDARFCSVDCRRANRYTQD